MRLRKEKGEKGFEKVSGEMGHCAAMPPLHYTLGCFVKVG